MGPPSGQLQTSVLQRPDADPSIDETAPCIDDFKETVVKLRSRNEAVICNFSADLLKAVREAIICGLHAVLTAVWHSGTIHPDWKKGLIVSIWKGKGTLRTATTTAV